MSGFYRYAAQVAYRGGGYAGWQRQAEALGVQQVLEEALLKLSPNPVKITGSGRTDKGVHAVGQVVSFALEKEWEPNRLRLAMNFYLPEDVRVMRVFPVPLDFDARRSALWREYRYFVWHGWVCPPHLNGLVWWRKAPWDTALAREACRELAGEHDFRAFCKTGECPENSVRTLSRVRLQRWGAMSVLTVRAPSFLMNMVRILVGNVDAVARGEEGLDWLKELLRGTARDCSAMTAPACGLWFWRAGYRELPEISPLGGEGEFFGGLRYGER
ncbi:MAG: tRNA pseudouridine(38-40) synthase TruA [Synergistaceae bacterium]|nr:tRNA pseudouridine(38-40) synthase TruA [Synergistaceae bacterium]